MHPRTAALGREDKSRHGGQKQTWGQIQILRGKIRADMGDRSRYGDRSNMGEQKQTWGTRADMGDKGKHGGQEQILKGKIKSRHEGADLDLERQVILPVSVSYGLSIRILTNYLIIRSLCKVIRESV